MPHLFRPSSTLNRYYAWFSALHTRVDLLLLAPLPEPAFLVAEVAIHSCLQDVEHMGNRFDPASEISIARDAASPPADVTASVAAAKRCPAPLSASLFSLLARCLRAYHETGGLFDITVNSPHFTPGLIHDVELIPSPTTGGGSLLLHQSDIILDLSGILKGYALERLRQLLPTLGIHDALISLGNSSILSLGSNPSDIPAGQCLTTSGNATPERRHIRHPLTGRFITGQRQVSVITPDGIDGEILSITRFIQEA